MTTFAALIGKTSVQLQDSGNANWSTSEIGGHLDDIQDELCTKFNLLKTRLDLTENTAYDPTRLYAYWYSPDKTIVTLYGVTFNGKPLALSSVDIEQGMNWSWEDLTGTPERYIFGEDDTDATVRNIRLVPYPTTTAVVPRGRISYLGAAYADGAGAISPSIPVYLHMYMPYGAAARCFRRDGTNQDLDAADRMEKLYQEGVVLAERMAESNGNSGTPNIIYPYH